MATKTEKDKTRELDETGEVKPLPPTPASDIPKADKPTKHGQLLVKASPEAGFNRAGIRFSHNEETIIPANWLDEKRYRAIKNEPKLTVLEA